jgi:hydrogenase/urease accessory protein HupE
MDWFWLLLISLGTFTAWEWVAVALPFSLPAWLQPITVVGLAYEVQRLPERWLLAVAAAGAVALLHTVVRGGVVEAPPLRVPRRHPATGRRVPDLP